MAGPFDRFLGPWDKMRQSPNVDDRRDDPWPWHEAFAETPIGTPTLKTTLDIFGGLVSPEIPPVTALSRDAGARDVEAISPEELIKFLINVDSLNVRNEETK